MTIRSWKLSIFMAAMLGASNVQATNGLNLIGFGAESSAMAGADIAVARDTLALNTNPAGITQIPHRQLDLYAGATLFDVSHSDRLQSGVSSDNNLRTAAQFGYVTDTAGGVVHLGMGLFVQAGAGADFRSLRTVFGTTDTASLDIAAAKLQFGAALRLNERLSLGASLAVVHAELEQKFFPDTSVFNPADPTQSFFGTQIKRLKTQAPGVKLGLLYQPSDTVRIGLAYTHRTDLEFKDGQFISNFSALNPQLGKVIYRRVTFSGLDLPQEIGLSIAWQVSDAWLVAAEINHIDWSNAVKRTQLTATNPNRLGASAEIRQITILNWHDQIVYAIGAIHALNERFMLRVGYNRATHPVPEQNLNPLLGPIGEDHLTFGMGYRINRHWHIDGSVEYQLRNKVTYNNPNLPFGDNVKLGNEILMIHLQLSRHW